MIKQTIEVIPADLDAFGAVSPARWLDWMQRVADIHANGLHMGREHMLAHDLVWMLARNAVALKRAVGLGERVCVSTWTGESTRAACPRYFEMESEAGEPLGSAATLWMLINRHTRRIVPPSKVPMIAALYEEQPPSMPLPAGIDRIETVSQEMLRDVRFSDLDVNGHVNNVRYMEWVMDLLPYNLLRTHYAEDFRITYHREIKPLTRCLLRLELKEAQAIIEGRDEAGEELFEAQLTLASREGH